jgi:hypothetical protein
MQGATYIDTVKTQKCIDIKSTKQNACISTLLLEIREGKKHCSSVQLHSGMCSNIIFASSFAAPWLKQNISG